MIFRIAVIGAAVSAKLLPHTYFLQKYRQYRATYDYSEKEMPVPEEIQQRFREVMDDLKLPEEQKAKIELFSVHDINIFHAGSTRLDYHAIIGIPPNFGYKSADNLTIDQVQIQNKYIPWTEETSRQFLQSLVFSEKAQKFAIAREILKLHRLEFFLKPLSLGMDLIVTFALYDIFYSVLKLAKKPKLIGYMFKTAVALASFSIWMITEHTVNSNIDQEITKQLAALGPEYIQGGKEFFEKLCERDNVLAHFVDRNSLNSSNGNWIMRWGLSPSEQKEFLTLKLQELETA